MLLGKVEEMRVGRVGVGQGHASLSLPCPPRLAYSLTFQNAEDPQGTHLLQASGLHTTWGRARAPVLPARGQTSSITGRLKVSRNSQVGKYYNPRFFTEPKEKKNPYNFT